MKDRKGERKNELKKEIKEKRKTKINKKKADSRPNNNHVTFWQKRVVLSILWGYLNILNWCIQ